MKKMMIALTMMLLTAATGKAMSYEQARNEALFLTDKMAYELNLTDAQYEAAYEINLDYLMGVTSVDDVYGTYWERRNLDLSYILYQWQWDAFRAATYFFRPLYWDAGYWHFGIYARYPRRDYFYFGRPHFYATYRGAHAWHLHGTHGYYHGHVTHFRPALPQGRTHFGMRNSYDRGDYRGSRAGSSTRVTGQRGGHYQGGGRYQGGRDNGNYNNRGGYGNRGGNSGSYNRSENRGGYERSNSGHFSRNSSNFNRGSSTGSSNFNRGSSTGSSNFNRGSSTGSSNFNRGGSSYGSVGSHSGSGNFTRSGGNAGGSNRGGGHFDKGHR